MSILQFPKDITTTNLLEIYTKISDLSIKLKQKPVSHAQQQNIFHQQILKSSLFSARIEGNHLTLVEAKNINFQTNHDQPDIKTDTIKNTKQKSKLEISNVLKTLENIHKLPKLISNKTILAIHKQVMSKIDNKSGKFRKESSGIFDGYGNIVYLTPEPKDTVEMLEILFEKINSRNQQTQLQQLITTAQSHYYFEKSHPFIDGNGRVGRVLLQYQLLKTNLFANYILPIDEYFEKNKSDYYFHLEKNTRNIEQFIVYFLEGIIYSLEKLIKEVDRTTAENQLSYATLSQEVQNKSKTKSIKNRTNIQTNNIKFLLPRRQELIMIIQDHPYISLDSLSRRFPTIPKRTIAYDVNWLVKKEFIIKHGKTRGVRYSISN